MKLFLALVAAAGLLFPSILGLSTNSKLQPTAVRAFEEPLVPIGTTSSSNDNDDLVSALEVYQKRQSYEDVSAITTYLNSHPNSPWAFSLLANLGIIYRKTGHFSKAIDSWEQAWALGKSDNNYKIQALANRVAADLATLLSSLGRSERLAPLLSELKTRTFYGSSNAHIKACNENLWFMKNQPGQSFKCGPYALDSIREFSNNKNVHGQVIKNAQSSTKGFTLTQVQKLSDQLQMNYQMAKRQPGAVFIVPSVVHWKSGHFAALLKKQGESYVTKDPTFGQSLLITAQALEDEASGYFLVPSGPLPTGWQPVQSAEGDNIRGRGVTYYATPTATKPDDKKTGCDGQSSNGMAVYNIFAMLISLNIQDTPVGYTPALGPDVHFTIAYNQLEADQPANFSFFNFGPGWNCDWLSYVTIPTSSGGTAYVNVRGGGQETYSSYASTGSTYPGYAGNYGFEPQSHASLWVTNSGTYERRLPDGSKEVFGKTDPAGFVFLSAITDPQGNSLTLTYDSSYRLTSVTDALGLVTTLTYGLASDALKVTRITDPYNRAATFSYTSSTPYQLTSITDVIGITSQFTYVSGSMISQMVTPYGTTTFSYSASSYSGYTGSTPQVSSLTVTEPDGSKVKAERRLDGTNYPYFPPGTTWTAGENAAIPSTEPQPSGYGIVFSAVDYLQYRNTYYWDKKATHDVPGSLTDDPASYASSYIYHWQHTTDDQGVSPVVESEKPALENRIWYTYPTPGNDGITYDEGPSAAPLQKIRVVNNSNPSICQAWTYTYNVASNPALVTSVTDPLGRQTNYTYATNGIDLIKVTQNRGTSTDTLETILPNGQHEPLTITDAAGQTTTFTYNSLGQVQTMTPPTRASHGVETTTYGYTNNYLTSISAPVSGAVTSLTYDFLNGQTVNRIKTLSDSETYTRTFTYDNFDRVTQIAYPDSTTETFSYLNPSTSQIDLDLHSSTDRLSRTTTRIYDSTRHLTSITDPLSRTTRYTWCSCGSMMSLQDANTNVTTFNRDLESRLTSKVYQDTHGTSWSYDPILGNLAMQTDARGNITNYSYNLDNTVSAISYTLASGTSATPNVTYAYDSSYSRLTSAGGVSMSYVPAGSLGANKIATITNTLTGASPLLTYSYDEWGRQVGRTIDSNNPQSVVFDSLGRVTSLTNALCPTGTSFAYAYFDPTHPTNRVASITYPNGQTTVYNYFGNTVDQRLQEIKNLNVGTLLSQNDYTYDAVGKILTWQQTTDSNTPLLWTEGYDLADQLTSATQTNTAISSPATIQDIYAYDRVGNRTGASLSGVTRSETPNPLNQLTASTATGNQSVNFTGTVNGSDTVTVNGGAATRSGANFSGSISLPPGSTNTIAVVAQDAAGNSLTNKYQTVVPSQLNYSPTYDFDGNELTNGAGQTYTWDAKNELVTVNYPTAVQKLIGPVIGTIGSYNNDGNTRDKAFDGDLSTFFDAPGPNGNWVGLDLGTLPVSVSQIKYVCRPSFGYRMVGGVFQASNTADFSSGVVTLATISATPSDGVWNTVAVSGATGLRYVRYVAPDWSQGDVAELEFDGQSITQTAFTYDALGRQTQIVENIGSTVVSTKQLVWDGSTLAEERDATGTNVTKRFFALGEQIGGLAYYYTRDHLGSVREMTDSTGAIQARYDYDPCGRTTLVSGTNLSDFQYAGYYTHQPSGLNLTLYRAYAPNTARWLSRDPLGEGTDATLYSYCANNPIDRLDPWGLDYTQTGPNFTYDTDTNGAGPHPNDPSHQNQLPPGSQGNAVPGVVAPPGHGIHVGDPATLNVNGHQVQCVVTDTSDNHHRVNHEHRPEGNTTAGQAAGLGVANGPQGPVPTNGQPGNPDIPASIYFPTGHP